MKGIIFDLSRFCLNDGPGIRTTIFLKGCPLQCAWCHNPESQSPRPEILFDPNLCTRCGACAQICSQNCHRLHPNRQFHRAQCIGCGACAEVCPTTALRLAGKETTAEEVMEEVLKDLPYYQASDGGLTVSGGEPLMQPDFLEDLLRLAKENGIHTCIETCGYAPRDAVERILPYTDCFLFDWKESDPKKHRDYTGKDQKPILENLAFLDSRYAEIILRIPFIPGYNDRMDHQDGIADLAKKYKSIQKIEIMPYHPMGLSKEKELGKTSNHPTPTVPDRELLISYAEMLRAKVNVLVEICV